MIILMNDTCLAESYSSLKLPCFYIGSCKYDEYVINGEEITNTPVNYFDDGSSHEVTASLKQLNLTTSQPCFTETITDSITYSANITYDSNVDSRCSIKSGNIQTDVSICRQALVIIFSMSTYSTIRSLYANMFRQMPQKRVESLLSW